MAHSVLVHVPPDKDGARGGVADTASAVSEEVAQLGKVLQLAGVENPACCQILVLLCFRASYIISDNRP